MEQRRKKEEAAKRILTSAYGTTQKNCNNNEEDDEIVPRGPKRQLICASLNDVDNCSKAIGSSIKKSEAGRFAFKQRRLNFEERVHKDMLQESAIEQTDGHETEKCWEKRELDRMKVFVEFSMKAIVSAIKETTT